MRPKDFKSPFTWEERRVLLQERVLFVPFFLNRQDPFVMPAWHDPELFGNTNPVKVEYCSGNGHWIIEKARLFPQLNWVAVERKFDRIRKIVSKRENLQLKNLVVVCGEGYTATRSYFQSESVDEVFVNFPDPWPKKKHWKNRIINQSMLKEFSRVLKKDGVATFVTDDIDYSEVMVQETHASLCFQSLHPFPHYIPELDGYGNSYFEDLWRSQGKTIRYHQFKVSV